MNDAAIGKMFADLERAEGKLIRAWNKWIKLKARVKRFDKATAKAFNAEADAIPVGAKPWPDKGGKLHVPKFGVKETRKKKRR